MTLEDIWRQKSDEELIAAAAQLTDYTEDAQPVIQAEIRKRGIQGYEVERKRISNTIPSPTLAGTGTQNLQRKLPIWATVSAAYSFLVDNVTFLVTVGAIPVFLGVINSETFGGFITAYAGQIKGHVLGFLYLVYLLAWGIPYTTVTILFLRLVLLKDSSNLGYWSTLIDRRTLRYLKYSCLFLAPILVPVILVWGYLSITTVVFSLAWYIFLFVYIIRFQIFFLPAIAIEKKTSFRISYKQTKGSLFRILFTLGIIQVPITIISTIFRRLPYKPPEAIVDFIALLIISFLLQSLVLIGTALGAIGVGLAYKSLVLQKTLDFSLGQTTSSEQEEEQLRGEARDEAEVARLLKEKENRNANP